MMDRILIKNYDAAAAVTVRRIVRFDSSSPNPSVQHATAATDSSIGVSTMSGDSQPSGTPGVIASGNRVDVILLGITELEAGAAFSAGALLTADSTGRGIVAAPAAGVNNRVVGIALQPASAAGDIVQMCVNPISLQG